MFDQLWIIGRVSRCVRNVSGMLVWQIEQSHPFEFENDGFREVKRLRRRFDDSATIRFPTIHLTQKLVLESSAEASAESTVKCLL